MNGAIGRSKANASALFRQKNLSQRIKFVPRLPEYKIAARLAVIPLTPQLSRLWAQPGERGRPEASEVRPWLRGRDA